MTTEADHALPPLGLIDELFLMIHPVVLGSGHRLFGPADDAVSLRLVDSVATPTGLTLSTYQPIAAPSIDQVRGKGL